VSDKTDIEWCSTVQPDGTVTKGSTWNPVRGCTKVSPGCAHCYAEVFAERFRGVPGHPYEQGFDLRPVPEKLTEPLSWKKPRRVFVNSMSDLFQDGVPDDYIDQVFASMWLASKHTFQVLTKRPQRMLAYLMKSGRRSSIEWARTELQQHVEAHWSKQELLTAYAKTAVEWDAVYRAWPLPNVWLGVSVENQHFADERIPLLLQTPAAVRFISAEPLLGRVDLRVYLQQFMDDGFIPALADKPYDPDTLSKRLDWVIVGGESGAGARPFDIAWARSIVDQCRSARVPVFVKQLGSFPVVHPNDEYRDTRLWASHVGLDCSRVAPPDTAGGPRPYRPTLRSSKGGDMSEWPEDLRVREFPR
jgi:protein gp37